MDGAQRGVTVLLDRWGQGDRAAFDALVPLIYDGLRRVAANHLRGERRGHSLCPTELVSEACVRLIGATPPEGWNGRVHFFAIAARSMRQILVDPRAGTAPASAVPGRGVAVPPPARIVRPDGGLRRRSAPLKIISLLLRAAG